MRINALPVFITFHSSTLIVFLMQNKRFSITISFGILSNLQAASRISIAELQFVNEFESYEHFSIEVQQEKNQIF